MSFHFTVFLHNCYSWVSDLCCSNSKLGKVSRDFYINRFTLAYIKIFGFKVDSIKAKYTELKDSLFSTLEIIMARSVSQAA